MELKTVEVEGNTYAEISNGMPVFVIDGQDKPFDVPGMSQTIKNANSEAKNHREAKEAAEKALKAFEGITDPQEAIKALETVSNLEGKKLIDAGEVETLKAQITKTYEEKLSDADKRAENAQSALHKEMIGGRFARSEYISEKLAVPVDMVEATFGGNFSIEEGKVAAKDAHGDVIRSETNPGEVAGFDEALELLVKSYPNRDQILKGTGAQGTGATPGGKPGGPKQISRAEFDKLSHSDKAAKIKDGFKVV